MREGETRTRAGAANQDAPFPDRGTPGAAELGLPESVACPFCDGERTELHAPFGTALSVATYWCRDCRTAFEWVKWD